MDPDPDEHQHPGEEDLDWVDETVKGKKPKGLYSKTSETARGFISSERQCALFCGGKKCKYCSGEGWSEEETVIKGLYSQWVTDNILAMARPSNYSIQKYDIVQQFRDAGINSIVNLQIKGEHADCGPEKLDDSGFLYNPQTFMDNGIFFYNFGWPDYGVASLSTILDMIKVMQFAVSQGKVAVHCHAGRGRTGVIIACYLVFTNRISGIDAIHYVRDKRPNSIQTRQQMQVIQEFEQYLKPFRTVFASRQTGSHEFSLQQFLNRQRHILHGYEARRLKYVPKIVYTVCERLLELAKKGSFLQKDVDKSAEDLSKAYQSQSIVHNGETKDSQPASKSASKESLFPMTGRKKRYKASLLATRSRYKSVSMEDLDDEKFKEVLDGQDKVSLCSSNSGVVSRASEQSDEEDDDDSIVYGNSTINLKAAADDNINGETKKSNDNKINGEGTSKRFLDNVSLQSQMTTWSIDQSVTGHLSEELVQTVTYALSAKEVEEYVVERAATYEIQLNETDTAYTALSTEGDPHVLAQILWDWLDQLKEPILRAQDLAILIEHVESPDVGLRKVEKGTKSTIEYLMKIISKLCPINEDTLVNIYEKLLCHLSHQWVVFNNVDLTKSWAGSTISSQANEKEHWSDMRPDIAERLFRFVSNLQSELQKKISSKLVR